MKFDDFVEFYQIRTGPGTAAEKKRLKSLSRAERIRLEREQVAGKAADERRRKTLAELFAVQLNELVPESAEVQAGAEIAARLAQLIGVYPEQKNIRVVRVGGKEERPFFRVETVSGMPWPKKWIRVDATTDGKFLYTLGEDDIKSAECTLSNVDDPDRFLSWVKTVISDPESTFSYEHHPSGQLEDLAHTPAQRTGLSISRELSTKAEADRFYQSYEIAKRLVRGLESELERIAKRVTNPDWNAGAITLGGEAYLSDFVEDATYRAVTEYLKESGPETVAALKSVNARVTKTSIRPVVTLSEEQTMFGRTIMAGVERQLGEIPLPHPIDLLEIGSIDLYPDIDVIDFSRMNKRMAIPPEFRPNLEVPFYRRLYAPDMDLRARLYKLLDDWAKSEGMSGKKRRREGKSVAPAGLHEHLAVLGLTIEDMRGKTRLEQQAAIKAAWRRLLKEEHPDIPTSTEEATEVTRQILASREYLVDEKNSSKFP